MECLYTKENKMFMLLPIAYKSTILSELAEVSLITWNFDRKIDY